MKITGARAETFSAMRKRNLAQAGVQATGAVAPADKTAFLGLAEADLTPAVQGALKTLLTEIDDLRGEVGRLKARLSEVEGLADQDSLTPLLNRRAFMRELGRISAFSARYGSPASLAYFDLDGFKAVNDRFGHAAGDQILRLVAERLKATIGNDDLAARIGGDEFVVIQAHVTGPDAAEQLGHRIVAALSEPYPIDGATAMLGASFGVAVAPQDGTSLGRLLRKADASLYTAKRNRPVRSRALPIDERVPFCPSLADSSFGLTP